MLNIKHLLKVTAAWITLIYVVCFGAVALLPGIVPWFMQYALHLKAGVGDIAISYSTFISGLLVWNLITLLVVWLFAFLFSKIKQ